MLKATIWKYNTDKRSDDQIMKPFYKEVNRLLDDKANIRYFQKRFPGGYTDLYKLAIENLGHEWIRGHYDGVHHYITFSVKIQEDKK